MPDSLYQYLAPIVKAHPSILWILVVATVLAIAWSFTPHAAKMWVGRIKYVGPRIVGVFDLASAIAMFVLGRIYHVTVEQILKGNLPPETINRATPETLIVEALKKTTPAEIMAMVRTAAPTIVIGDASKSTPAAPKLPPVALGAFLMLAGCSGTQTTPSAAVAEFRVVTHAIAVVLCAARPIGEVLLIPAEAAYPALRIVPPIADAFCAAVEHESERLAGNASRNASRALPADTEEPRGPASFAIGESGFAVLAR